MVGNLVDKKYPSITVQGVLLASSVLYLEHGGAKYCCHSHSCNHFVFIRFAIYQS